jgi:hypothetical protein
MKTKSIVTVVAIALIGTAACTPTTQPMHRSGGGGGGGGGQHHAAPAAGFVDAWSESDLVDDDGNANVAADEDVVDHPSTESTDSGFDGAGPPAFES